MNRAFTRASGALAVVVLGALHALPARALDRPGALAEAARANPMLQGRRAMTDAARARIAPAGAWPAPMLELGAINVPASGRFDMDPMTMRMVGLRQRVPVAGANGLARRAAAEAANADADDADATHWQVMGETWAAYADAYWSADLAHDAARHRAEMEQLVRAARARYESGGGRLDDLLRAEAEAARTRAEEADFAAAARESRAALDALLGREPGADDADTLEAPAGSVLPADAAAWTAALDAHHPRLGAFVAQSRRWSLAEKSARRMAWPELEVSLSYGIRGTVMDVKQDDMWSGMVGVMLPVFARSRELPMAREMAAMSRAADADGRAARLELASRITAAHARALAASHREALYADTVCVVQAKALAASWSSYTAGATDLSRVLESMHALYEDRLALVAARRERARAEGELVALLARRDALGATLPAPADDERSPR